MRVTKFLLQVVLLACISACLSITDELCELYDAAAAHSNSTDHLDASEDHQETFEGDIYPTYDTIATAYGKELAEELGLEPETSKRLGHVLPEGTIHFWKNDLSEKYKYFRITVWICTDTFSKSDKKIIKKHARKLARRVSVIKFKFVKDKPTSGPFIRVYKGSGCGSFVGQVEAAFSKQGQPLSLSENCLKSGIIQHEFLHALGLYHEQARFDRDKYVTINWDNIEVGREINFHSLSKSESNYNLGIPYDLESVMHYSKDAWAKDGVSETIDTHGMGANVGQREAATGKDVVHIRLIYQCFDRTRRKDEYRATKCLARCPCGLHMVGCEKKNDSCRGAMECINNKCIMPG